MSSDIIDIEKIEEYSWKNLMDMDIYSSKKFSYSGGNVLKYLLQKDRESIANLKYIDDNTFDLRIQCHRFTFRIKFNINSNILSVDCIVPCPKCNSADTHVYVDAEDWKEDKSKDEIVCHCLTCRNNFKI